MAARTRHRVFLALGVATGLVLVTMGHVGSTTGWGAADLRTLLDGVLSPLRNVHKFDLVLRLPLALGVALDGGAPASRADHPHVRRRARRR